MIKVELSVVVNRPAAEVFAFVVDPANNKKWQKGLVESRLTSPGPVGVGSQITDVRKIMGRDLDSKLEVIAFESNKTFGEKVVSGPLQFEIMQTFEPSGDGTKVSLVAHGEPGGFFKLAEGLVQKQLQSQLEGDSQRLKKALED